MKIPGKRIIQIILLSIGVILLAAGISSGGMDNVKNKAVTVCLECIGIG